MIAACVCACLPLAKSQEAAFRCRSPLSPHHADYGFEYSDEEVEEEDVDIENQYYNSKGERGGS